MYKRVLTCFLSVVMITSMSAAMPQPAAASQLTEDYWSQFSSHVYYDQLNSAEKNFYDAMRSEAYRFLSDDSDAEFVPDAGSGGAYCLGDVSISGIELYRAVCIFNLFCYENPQYFFLNNLVHLDRDTETVRMQVYPAYATALEKEKSTAEFRTAVDSYLAGAEPYVSDLAKETYFHDRIIDEVSYEDSAGEGQSASSVFLEKKSVCAGLTKAMSLLLNASGVENVGVTSNVHAWNEVNIDGTWYVTDITWDEDMAETGGSPYRFFNVSESEITSSDTLWQHDPESIFEGIRPLCITDHTKAQDPADLTVPAHPSSVKAKRKGSSVTLIIRSPKKTAGVLVTYRKRGSSAWKTRKVSMDASGKRVSLSIKGLKKASRYEIRVQCLSASGVVSAASAKKTV